MVSLVLQHFIDLAHNATAPPQQLARRRHSGAHTGGTTTARANRPCLFIVKRRVTDRTIQLAFQLRSNVLSELCDARENVNELTLYLT